MIGLETISEWILIPICTVLLAIVGYFLVEFKRGIDKSIDDFAGILGLSTDALNNHRESMGKATKAINGDMLEIRKSILELKEDFAGELIKMKSQVQDVELKSRDLVSDLKIASSQFTDKFSRILQIQNEMTSIYTEVQILEKQSKELYAEMGENKERDKLAEENIEKLRLGLQELKKISHKILKEQGDIVG